MSHPRRRQSSLPPPGRSGLCTLKIDQTGTLVAETRYLPYGEERWITGTLVTDFTFTGQRAERGFGLMDYNARYYDPWLGRFVSADTLVPNPGDPQDLNRYAYAGNNPLRYTDPTGHYLFEAEPDDPFLWRQDKPGDTDTLIRTAEPMVETRQITAADLFKPFAYIYGGAAVGVFWEAVVAEVGTIVIGTGGSVATAACADGDCTNEAQTVGKALDAACADGNCTNELQAGKQLINITEKGWRHVVERHTVNGLERYASKSKFSADVNVKALITQASSAPALEQPNGYLVRIVDAGMNIGVDMTTGKLTTVYTVVTNAVNELITAFPGTPLR